MKKIWKKTFQGHRYLVLAGQKRPVGPALVALTLGHQGELYRMSLKRLMKVRWQPRFILLGPI
jgi:hypothetical protein